MLNWNPVAEHGLADPRWVTMRRLDDGRKIPLASQGKTASISDPTTWQYIGEALTRIPENDRLDLRECAAIALLGDLLVFDFDKSVEGNKLISLDAVMLLGERPSYAEVSMSRRGLHLFYALSEQWTPPRNRLGSVCEVYTHKRFLSLTGLGCELRGTRIVLRPKDPPPMATITPSEALELMRMMGWRDEPPPTPSSSGQSLGASDEELLKRAMKSASFVRLWNGDIADYPSHSEADCALVGMLARLTADRAQIERLWLASPLGQRDKTQKRADYRERTLDKVRAGDPSRVHSQVDLAIQKHRRARAIIVEQAMPKTLGGWGDLALRAYHVGISREILLDEIAERWGDDVADSIRPHIYTVYDSRKRR